MRRQLAIPIAAVLTAALLAQDGGDITIQQRVDEVIAPTTVLDKDGSYVTGLKPMEFKLYDNDKPQTIKVEEVVSPVSLVVAIQADYKVEKVLPKIQKIGNLLENMVAGDNGEIAVIAFDHRIQKLQDFTTDSTKVVEALQKLKPGSSQSVLTDAVNEAARMLEKRPKERRRVLLLICRIVGQRK